MSNQITWNNQVIRVNKSSVFFFSLVGKKSALNISCAFSTRKVTPWCLLKLSCRNTTSRVIFYIIIWLALWEGKMNQILRCDWLPERARWSYLAHSGLPAVSRKENFRESHIINPLLTELVCQGQDCWILASFFFCEFMDLDLPSWPHTWSMTHTLYVLQPSICNTT